MLTTYALPGKVFTVRYTVHPHKTRTLLIPSDVSNAYVGVCSRTLNLTFLVFVVVINIRDDASFAGKVYRVVLTPS